MISRAMSHPPEQLCHYARMRLAGVVACCAILLSRGALAEDAKVSALRLTLPPVVYAVPGVEMSIYFDNVILAPSTTALSFTVECDVGQSDKNRWTVKAHGWIDVLSPISPMGLPCESKPRSQTAWQTST